MDTHTLEDALRAACHTAVSELPGVAYEDMVDCVFGQVSSVDAYGDNYPQVHAFILYWLHQYGADISGECRGHETENFNGPIGTTDYCNGLCEAREHI
jgi:hypothetical protein